MIVVEREFRILRYWLDRFEQWATDCQNKTIRRFFLIFLWKIIVNIEKNMYLCELNVDRDSQQSTVNSQQTTDNRQQSKRITNH